ncbi:MAG: hypothetical protein EHM65_02465 [Acidobacteriales bacterium]|nr:MAG: hypothetical protein EHM65_02465 [Terriglobales bacterium]
MDGVRVLLEEAIAQWQECDGFFPQGTRRFSEQEQALREEQLARFLGSLEAEVARLPRTRSDRDGVRERLTEAFVRLAKSGLGMEDRHLDLLLGGGFSGVGTALARQARRFDPVVSAADILQACRNAWTACGLQVLLGHPMQVTPSIFAYSMLYPYSDNYMDDPKVPGEEKVSFSGRFGRRLEGDSVRAANAHEEKIWRLVGLIEDQYPRPSFPQVYSSLLAIHRAQFDSLRLSRSSTAGGEADILRLGFAKGGTSVLADGYLAAGSLTAEEARFIFLWGVVLQLGDDLQDVRDDHAGGILTLFSQAAGKEPLDAITSRTFHFGERVMSLLEGVGVTESGTLKELMRRSSRSFLLRCAGEAGALYTPEYLAQLEACSPYRFPFLNRRREQFSRRQAAFTRLFEAFLAGGDDEPAFPLLPSSLMPRL